MWNLANQNCVIGIAFSFRETKQPRKAVRIQPVPVWRCGCLQMQHKKKIFCSGRDVLACLWGWWLHAAKERCCWFLPALWGVISMPVASPLLCATMSCPVFVLQASSWSTCGPGAQEKLWWPRRWMRWGCCEEKDEAGAFSCSVCKTWQVCVCVHGENSFLSGPLTDLLAAPQEKARNT